MRMSRGSNRSLRNRVIGLVLMLGGLGGTPTPPVHAHGASAGDKPIVNGELSLHYLRASEVISLFAREELPSGGRVPRAAHAGTEESLLPAGIEGLLLTGEAKTVTLVGRDDRMPQLQECLQVLDVPVQATTTGRQRVVLTLHHGNARALRTELLRLPGRGTATASGHQLVLEGTPAWLHRSLRQVIRGELGVATSPAVPML